MRHLLVFAQSLATMVVRHADTRRIPAQCEPYVDFKASIKSDFERFTERFKLKHVHEALGHVKLVHEGAWIHHAVEVVIINGTLRYRKPKDGFLPPLLKAELKLIAMTVEMLQSSVPDVYFVVSVADDPTLARERVSPVPLFSVVTTDSHWDVLVPGVAYFDDDDLGGMSAKLATQEEGTFAWWQTEEFKAMCENKHPWATRGDRAFFRGYDWLSSNEHLRHSSESCMDKQDIALSFEYRRFYADSSKTGGPLEGVLDVGLTDAQKYIKKLHPERQFVPPVRLSQHAQHKYLLHLDGITYSSRLLKLLMVGSVVLKQDSPYEEYFYRYLRPWVHFVPFARNRCDANNLTAQINHLRKHDTEAQAIADRGQQIARRLFTRTGAACYWLQVLIAYADLQDFEPRRDISILEFTRWEHLQLKSVEL